MPDGSIHHCEESVSDTLTIHLPFGCSWKEHTLSRNRSPWYSLGYLLVVVVLILLIILLLQRLV
jgi:hypothetical protein